MTDTAAEILANEVFSFDPTLSPDWTVWRDRALAWFRGHPALDGLNLDQIEELHKIMYAELRARECPFCFLLGASFEF